MSLLLSSLIGNALGLIIAAKALPNLSISHTWQDIAVVALLLTAGNILIKPVLKLLFTPFIWLTLGLFTIIINAFILYAVDFLSDYITISGLDTLLYASLILTAANLVSMWLLKPKNSA